ncbi:MAG: DegT/DnrJ/EryC1/StrS family aminotransferase [Candidatus Falkowbacteria bacterium]
MTIPFFNTYIHPDAADNIGAVLASTFLSEGKIVKEFEDKLNEKLKLSNPVVVNSGTSALHLAVILSGIKPGDEVILPAQTFVASGLAVLMEGAVPIFADIQYETGNINPADIEKKITEKTRAIMAVHWGGYPCDMDEILKIAKKYKLSVIEDAAHALGAVYKNRPIGTISDFTCFSFQAIKHLTTGDGGAICCLNKTKAKGAKTKRWFGIDRVNAIPSLLGEREYDIKELGYKYHLNDYAAALGLANLENFEERLEKRRRIAEIYRDKLKTVSGLKLFNSENDRASAHWLFGMHVENRVDFISALQKKGVPASVVHLGIDHNSIFGGWDQSLIEQRRFDKTQIHIPIHETLSDENIDYIINAIKNGW